MKRVIIFFLFLSVAGIATAQEISLFNSDGEPRAYIDTEDEDLTIYLWNGEPVCYLSSSSNGIYFNIYGFNGKQVKSTSKCKFNQ
jgi:hypothetical protein